jgi:hypothetical protein
LSIDGSMGAGAFSSFLGMLREEASTRSLLCWTRVLALVCALATSCSSLNHSQFQVATYRLMSPLGVLPVMSFSQASAHSRTTSIAYFLFLHSPEKANWFSGFPSGIL